MKQDRRVQYTKRMLKESLLSLLKEKPVEKITVKELCERADVNRSTFYVHYGSPQQLLNSILDEMYADISAKPQDFSSIRQFMLEICKCLLEYRALLQVISESGDFLALMFRLVGIWEESFMSIMRQNGLEGEKAALLYRYVSTGATFVIGTWVLSEENALRAEEFSAELEQLVLRGLSAYFPNS